MDKRLEFIQILEVNGKNDVFKNYHLDDKVSKKDITYFNSDKCDFVLTDFKLKDIIGTWHNNYANKNSLDAFLDSKRGSYILEEFKKNPEYYFTSLKNEDYVRNSINTLEEPIKLYKDSENQLFIGNGNNRISLLKLLYLSELREAKSKTAVEELDKKFTFYAYVKEIPQDKVVRRIVDYFDNKYEVNYVGEIAGDIKYELIEHGTKIIVNSKEELFNLFSKDYILNPNEPLIDYFDRIKRNSYIFSSKELDTINPGLGVLSKDVKLLYESNLIKDFISNEYSLDNLHDYVVNKCSNEIHLLEDELENLCVKRDEYSDLLEILKNKDRIKSSIPSIMKLRKQLVEIDASKKLNKEEIRNNLVVLDTNKLESEKKQKKLNTLNKEGFIKRFFNRKQRKQLNRELEETSLDKMKITRDIEELKEKNYNEDNTFDLVKGYIKDILGEEFANYYVNNYKTVNLIDFDKYDMNDIKDRYNRVISEIEDLLYEVGYYNQSTKNEIKYK